MEQQDAGKGIRVGDAGGARFDAALRQHEAGDIASARAAYRAILAVDPDHAASLHLLGLITATAGDPAAGAAMIERSIALAPDEAPAHNSLAFACRLLGRVDDALRHYRAAAALRPGSAEILSNLATTLLDRGEVAEAIALYRRAAACAPESAVVWYNLANALARHGAPDEVEACFERALALRPGDVDALANAGRWLLTQARWTAAETHLAAAARLDPSRAAPWHNLGVALQEQDRIEEASASYRRALALQPNHAGALHNLGALLLLQGETDAAAQCQAAAVAADPGFGAARLAFCMAQLPVLYRTEAEVAARRQNYATALDELIDAAREPAIARPLAAAIGAAQPFFLPYQGQDDRALQAKYGALACRVLATASSPLQLPAPPAAGERIRLGIVSGFFCRHTVYRLFLQGWLAHLDRRRFEVIGFHTGRGDDAQTARSAASCDRFVRGLQDAAAWRDAVRAAAPHVLLYPEIGMDPIAANLAAQRLAPVQCASWGQPVTSGMPTIDAFLSSDLMEPPDGAAHYTEKLVRLPNLGICWLPEAAPPPDRAALGFVAGGPVYWSGQALYKYLPQYDVVFPRIATAIGACRFVFIGFAKGDGVTALFRERLVRAFAAARLDAARYCMFLPHLPPDRFLAAVGAADVVLDTPGWSGGKSTLDCLAQDPAIVTLPGRFMRGRHTAAILRRIDCEATIATSLDDYVAIAVRLGRDAAWRNSVRRRVAAHKHRAFDDREALRALEDWLMRAVHSRAGHAPNAGQLLLRGDDR